MQRLLTKAFSHRILPGWICAGIVLSVSSASVGQTLTHGPVLGAVSDEGIKVWARSDVAAEFELRYSLRASSSDFSGGTTMLSSASDFTGVLSLAELQASTEYDYSVYLENRWT